jgi:hypothetical protein
MATLHFVDDDRAYESWLEGNRSGFVVNCRREPTSAYLILHRASCWTINGRQRWTTGGYVKAALPRFSSFNDGQKRELGESFVRVDIA